MTTRPCVRCKATIPADRLDALPETRLCKPCSEAVGSDFKVSYSQERLSKAGSMKRNYGSITPHKTRRKIEPLE